MPPNPIEFSSSSWKMNKNIKIISRMRSHRRCFTKCFHNEVGNVSVYLKFKGCILQMSFTLEKPNCSWVCNIIATAYHNSINISFWMIAK